MCGRYKPVDHKLILLPLREAFEDLFSQTYSRKQNITFLGHVQTCFRGKRWQDLLKLMDHVCKSALTKELQDKPNGNSSPFFHFSHIYIVCEWKWEVINACTCVMFISCVAATAVGGTRSETRSDSGTDPSSGISTGVCLRRGKKHKSHLSCGNAE